MPTVSHTFDKNSGARTQLTTAIELARDYPSSDSRTVSVEWGRTAASNAEVCIDYAEIDQQTISASNECTISQDAGTYGSVSYDPVNDDLTPLLELGAGNISEESNGTTLYGSFVDSKVGTLWTGYIDTDNGTASTTYDYRQHYPFFSSGSWDSATHSWSEPVLYDSLDVATSNDADGTIDITVSNEAGDSVTFSDVSTGSHDLSGLALSGSVSIDVSISTTDTSTTPRLDSVSVTGEPFPAPTNLVPTAASATSMDLSWTRQDSLARGSWEIYRSTDGSLGSLVATISDETVTSYTDSGLTESTRYYYTVRRVVDGESQSTDQVSEATVVPSPTNITGSLGTREITVGWDDNATNEDGYRVRWSDDGGATWSSSGDLAANETGYTISSLLDGTRYDLEIVAFGDGRESDPLTGFATTPSAAVTDFAADASVEDEFTLTWGDTANAGVWHIQHRVTASGNPWTDDGMVSHDVTPALTIANLLDGEEYDIRIRHETPDREGSWTTISPVTLLPTPGKPSADTRPTAFDITFADLIDNEDAVDVELATGTTPLEDGPMGSFEVVKTLAPNDTDATVDGLDQNTRHKVRVVAKTEHSTATSEATAVTTDFEIPSEGWFATFTDDQGEIARLDGSRIEGWPMIQPESSAVGEWRIDIRPDRRLREWELTETRIYLGGSVVFRGPFHTYRLNGGDNGVSDRLVGFDVVDKLRHGGVVYDVSSERGGVAWADFINTHTPFAANVTTPTETTVDEDFLAQDSPADLSFADLFGDPSNTDPWKRVGSGSSATIVPLQRSFLMEGESASGSYGTFFSSDFSGGEAANLDTAGQAAEWPFELDYDIPDGEFGLFLHIQGTNGSSQVKWSLDGTELADLSISTNGTIDWVSLHTSGAWIDPGQVDAGSHTLRAEVSSEFSENFNIDAVDPVDLRANHTLPNTLTNGRLDAPVDYPGVTIEGSEFDTTFNIAAATLDVTVDDPSGAATLQVRNDGTNWFPANGSETDTSGVTVDFAAQDSLGSNIEGRITLDGYGERDDAIPRTGFQPSELSNWELRIDTNSIRVIDDETFVGSPFEIADAIAEDSGLVFVPDYAEDSLVLNAFAPGEVVKDVDWTVVGQPEPVDTDEGFANSVTVFGPEDENDNRPEVEAVSQTSIDERGKIEAEAEFRPDAKSNAELESIARTELAKALAKSTVTGQLEIEAQILQPGYAYKVDAFEAIDERSDPAYTLHDARFEWGTMNLDFEGKDSLARALRGIETIARTTKRAL
ncbi:hypothetical protein C5C07_15380 [Haloferax sp. Atlit-4N]|uniref:fibronectin type III domain-containing protein n=1 Tax=Haloferax sp. Atlit-4N TaxID=2077206 RepID=UPI000E2235DE|nr:fibronectin type III domain-containing protein [Haloferax sp. Atlit-4N]RDZ53115.1 hypothetical protein C5C07_15380 [Haloferax sp. Atlit-4N]